MKRSKPLKRKTPLAVISKRKAAAALSLPAQLAESSHARKALARVLSPYSVNTQRAYRLAWARWSSWCAERGLAPAPVEPLQLVAHLEELAAARKPETVRTTLAALSAIDATARGLRGDPSVQPIRSHAVVHQWLRAWSREVSTVPKGKARPIAPDELAGMVRAIDEAKSLDVRRTWIAQRDRALIVIGWFAAMRRSELRSLLVSDVREVARGLEITIRRSKTDQAGAGAVIAIFAQAKSTICPVMAWRAWLRCLRTSHSAAIEDGIALPAFPETPLIEYVDGAPVVRALSETGIGRVVKKRAAVIGIQASAHSLRGGFATSAGLHGKEERDIQAHGRWRSVATMRGYMQRADAWRMNPTQNLGRSPTERTDDDQPSNLPEVPPT